MKPVTLAMLKQIPKAELHYHLDGSLRIDTILELAKENGVILPSRDANSLSKLVRVGGNCSSLVEYLEAYRITLSVMQTKSALVRCSLEAFELGHEDGCSYVEARFCPSLHTKAGLSFEQVLESVLEGRLKAEKTLPGFRGAIIVCAMRHHDVSESVELARLAVKFADKGVVGFDIAGPEKGFPAEMFKEAYAIAKEGGLGLTAHAGEADGWESVESAVKNLGVTRVGHGVALRENAAARNLMRERGICVESCITSNVLTKAVENIASHPAKGFVDEGLTLTFATDGVTMTDTTLSNEYLRAHTQLGLSRQQLLNCIRNGFLNSFQPLHVREAMAKEAEDKARKILEV